MSSNVKRTSTLDKRKLLYLSVGGTRYCVTNATITADPNSMLAILSSDSWKNGHGVNESDPLFIDRDGVLFGYVLNYLRSGQSVVLPEDLEKLKKLFLEASYFHLSELETLISDCLKTKGVWFHDLRWLPIVGNRVRIRQSALRDSSANPNKAYLDFTYYLYVSRMYSDTEAVKKNGLRYALCDFCSTVFDFRICGPDEHNQRVTLGQYCVTCGERERVILSLADLTEKAVALWKLRILESIDGQIVVVYNSSCVGVKWNYDKELNGIRRPNHFAPMHVPINVLIHC